MESPSSTVRRRAWINSSRQRLTLEDADREWSPFSFPSASVADDDVFSDGCFTGKIENWLLHCGSGDCSETSGQLSFESVLKANSSEEELSLGADVLCKSTTSVPRRKFSSKRKHRKSMISSLLNGGESISEVGLKLHPSSERGYKLTSSTPRQELCQLSLNLGHSMASSCPSSSTCKTTSSVSEVLSLCSEDAEATLYELGFGCDEPQVTVRIPPRFFTFPSVAMGINFRLFLDSQLRRIREEDPSLSLASRFRQVQVLTAMANAFYSLYSHVSRTPLQKLATPEFTFSSSPVERIERFRSSVRSEPRSPVERLKDTVSKMCLYTGSPRGSDSTSPQLSPKKRSSLPSVVDVVLEKVKTGATKKLDLGECDRSNSAVDAQPEADDDDETCNSWKEGQTEQIVAATGIPNNGNKICREEMECNKQMDGADSDCIKSADHASRTHSARTTLTLSGETVKETDHHFPSCQPELESCSVQRNAHLKPLAKVTHDLICPQIFENVHQAPFCTHSPKRNTLTPICSETKNRDISCPGSHNPPTQTAISEPDKDLRAGDVASSEEARSLPVLAPSGGNTQCCITVTGWEGASCSLNAPQSSHTSAVPPVCTCKEPFNEGKSCYLNLLSLQGLGHISHNLQQVNSFELEEVHSVEEEDFVHLETTNIMISPLSKKHQYKGEVARGDSMQSDSSGYADEEVSPASNVHSR